MKKEPLGKVLKDVIPPSKKTPEVIKKTPFIQFIGELGRYEKRVIKLLKDHDLDYDKFMVVSENMIRNNPVLLEVDRSSLFGAILTSAEMGLEPNTPAQLSFIIPYYSTEKGYKVANFQIGYHGYVSLMYRNKRVLKIMSELVFENDQFDRYIGDDMNWHFRYKPAENEKGKRKGVFAIVHIEGTEPAFKYLDKKQIEMIKVNSKSKHVYDEHNDPEGWMWKKAVIRQIAKLIPKGHKSNLNSAISIDGMIDAGGIITLDEAGNVRIEKQKIDKNKVEANKLNTIFEDDNIQDIEIIDEK